MAAAQEDAGGEEVEAKSAADDAATEESEGTEKVEATAEGGGESPEADAAPAEVEEEASDTPAAADVDVEQPKVSVISMLAWAKRSEEEKKELIEKLVAECVVRTADSPSQHLSNADINPYKT